MIYKDHILFLLVSFLIVLMQPVQKANLHVKTIIFLAFYVQSISTNVASLPFFNKNSLILFMKCFHVFM